MQNKKNMLIKRDLQLELKKLAKDYPVINALLNHQKFILLMWD